MLRDESYVGERLGPQLDDAMRCFLSDPSRNHFDAENGALSVLKLLDWDHAGFEHGRQGIDSLKTFFNRYADVLGTTPAARAKVRAGRFKLRSLDYAWSLNDAR